MHRGRTAVPRLESAQEQGVQADAQGEEDPPALPLQAVILKGEADGEQQVQGREYEQPPGPVQEQPRYAPHRVSPPESALELASPRGGEPLEQVGAVGDAGQQQQECQGQRGREQPPTEEPTRPAGSDDEEKDEERNRDSDVLGVKQNNHSGRQPSKECERGLPGLLQPPATPGPEGEEEYGRRLRVDGPGVKQ